MPLFELPKPEEIGLSSLPESTDCLSSNNNPGSRNDFFTVESWQQFVHNEFDWQNYDFPDVDQLEDQDVLDARDLIVQTEIPNKSQVSQEFGVCTDWKKMISNILLFQLFEMADLPDLVSRAIYRILYYISKIPSQYHKWTVLKC